MVLLTCLVRLILIFCACLRKACRRLLQLNYNDEFVMMGKRELVRYAYWRERSCKFAQKRKSLRKRRGQKNLSTMNITSFLCKTERKRTCHTVYIPKLSVLVFIKNGSDMWVCSFIPVAFLYFYIRIEHKTEEISIMIVIVKSVESQVKFYGWGGEATTKISFYVSVYGYKKGLRWLPR